MKSLLDEYICDFPDMPLYLQGNSGFASPVLYEVLEDKDCKYAIRLKENAILHKLAEGGKTGAVPHDKIQSGGLYCRIRRIPVSGRILEPAPQGYIEKTYRQISTCIRSLSPQWRWLPIRCSGSIAGRAKWRTTSRKGRAVLTLLP